MSSCFPSIPARAPTASTRPSPHMTLPQQRTSRTRTSITASSRSLSPMAPPWKTPSQPSKHQGWRLSPTTSTRLPKAICPRKQRQVHYQASSPARPSPSMTPNAETNGHLTPWMPTRPGASPKQARPPRARFAQTAFPSPSSIRDAQSGIST